MTPKIITEQRCQMAALACEAPSKAGHTISQWTDVQSQIKTFREMAAKVKTEASAKK